MDERNYNNIGFSTESDDFVEEDEEIIELIDAITADEDELEEADVDLTDMLLTTEQEELEDCLRVFKADEIFYYKDSTNETKPKERASIHLITNELYDNAFLIDKMIQYGIFGKLVFE